MTRGAPLVDLLVVVGLLVSLAAARAAFAGHVDLPSAAAPRHPVLFYNPKSGGGKAERFALAEEAGQRGIEAVELKRGDDLEALVRAAVARGADGLAMAGGDGSQAVVAAIAAELGLPYACIPAGTRNHFALDLGVDRDDVVGALDAFVDGGERWVDLGDVNGRVFVNNVSLGLYAEAVQHEGYRDAKIRTVLDTVPDVLGPTGDELDLRWRGPGGHEHRGGAAVLVSNNAYRFGRALGSGTRPRIDDGLLGITVVRCDLMAGRGRTCVAAPVAGVVLTHLRGRFGEADRRRYRRRGCGPRRAAGVPHPTQGPASARGPPAPGRLAVGDGSRGSRRGRGRAAANRLRPAPETVAAINSEDVRMDLMEIRRREEPLSRGRADVVTETDAAHL